MNKRTMVASSSDSIPGAMPRLLVRINPMNAADMTKVAAAKRISIPPARQADWFIIEAPLPALILQKEGQPTFQQKVVVAH